MPRCILIFVISIFAMALLSRGMTAVAANDGMFQEQYVYLFSYFTNEGDGLKLCYGLDYRLGKKGHRLFLLERPCLLDRAEAYSGKEAEYRSLSAISVAGQNTESRYAIRYSPISKPLKNPC
ncbi:MAG: hypothetical protein ACYST5_00645 [Planctomycetota bacterium]|jgi:hypothetical protein